MSMTNPSWSVMIPYHCETGRSLHQLVLSVQPLPPVASNKVVSMAFSLA